MGKRISVAMATYNGEKYLRQQLDSIYNQTLLPFEIVVCDDCSEDSTVEILEDYKQKFGLIYVRNADRLGAAKNFEMAVSLCQGEYIALSDQDDIWFENKIEELYKTLVYLEKKYSNKPVLVHSDAQIIDIDFKTIRHTFIGERDGKRKGLCNLLFDNSKVQGAASIFNRQFKELFLPIPNEVELYDYYASLVIDTFGIRYFIPSPLLLYRQHTSNVVGYFKITLKERLKRFVELDFRVNTFEERRSVHQFYIRFKRNLDKKETQILKDYFFVLDYEKNITTKIFLVIKNRFNCKGSVTKLLIKLIINHFKRKSKKIRNM